MPGLRIELKYFEGQPAIQHVSRVSKPGRRVYSGAQELPRVRNGLGITIVSTPKGVLSDAEARDAECRRRSARGGVLMSRIGKRPVPLPAGVTATTEGQILSVKGPKGTLSLQMRDEISYDISEDGISVQPANETKQARAFWGMQRTLVQNLVTGVTEGFTKVLEITGVGYRAAAQGKNLRLQLGYSHDVNVDVPEGIEVEDAGHDHGRDFGHRPPEGRPARRRDPPLAQARALQGQGHQISRRVYLPQRRQEEIGHGEIQSLHRSAPSASARRSGAMPAAAPACRSTARAGTSMRRSSSTREGRTVAAASTLEKERARQDRRDRRFGARTSAAGSPSAPRPPASPGWCSIVAASCSMAA